MAALQTKPKCACAMLLARPGGFGTALNLLLRRYLKMAEAPDLAASRRVDTAAVRPVRHQDRCREVNGGSLAVEAGRPVLAGRRLALLRRNRQRLWAVGES
jgi:hypothetical protein